MSNINIVVAAQVQDAVRGLDKVTQSTQRVSKQVDHASNSLKKHSGQYNSTAVATNKWAKGALQQAGFQVGDFVVQLQNGTNGLQAFGQQGSQLAGVFGPMGAVVGAGIAIFSSLAIAIQKAAGVSQSFTEAFKETNAAIDEYIDLSARLDTANSDYLSGLREATIAQSEFARELLSIKRTEALDAVEGLNKNIYRTVRANGFLNVSLNENVTRLVGLGNTSKSVRDDISRLGGAFIELRDAAGLEAQYAAALKIRDRFVGLVGPVENMNADQREFYQNLLRSLDTMRLLGAAGVSASSKIGEAYEALNQAYMVQSHKVASQQEEASNRRLKAAYLENYEIIQGFLDTAAAYQQYADLRMTSEQMQARQNDKILNIQKAGWAQYYQSRITGEYLVAQAAARAAAGAQVGRSRGRGGPTSEELGMYNMQLQLVQQQTEWEEKLASLNSKRTSGLSKMAKVVSVELSPEMKRLQTVAENVGQSFENAMMSAVEGTMNVKDAFKQMTASIISDLYRQFVVKRITGFISGLIGGGGTGSYGLPSFPVGGSSGGAPSGLTTSFAGGGYTGNGARAGGLDGKGGFMAMLHPRETVVDHSKGQGGGVTVVQNINISTGVQQTVRAEIKTLMPQIADAAKSAVADAKRRGGSYGRAMA